MNLDTNIHNKIKEDIKNISYQDITNEVIDKIDLNVYNIYVEFLANDIIEHKFINHEAVNCSRDKLYVLLIYYHPKLFEYVFAGQTIEGYNKHRQNMLTVVDELINKHKDLTTEHNNRLVNVKHLLEIEPKQDILNMTSLEYGFYFTWAIFKKGFVDISRDELIKINTFDILAINIRWNLQHDDSIIMYKDVKDTLVPVLTQQMIKTTKKYETYPLTKTPTGPISLYDKNFNPIDKLTTDKICVVFDYGNDYYTKLFIGKDEITQKFANSIIDRKIIPNYNKRLLHSIIDRDVYMFLPNDYYEPKQDNTQLITNINKIKKIVMDSFSPNITSTINNILTHKLTSEVFASKHDRDIFKLYLSYLHTLNTIDLNTVIDIVENYIYDNNILQLQLS